MGASTNNIQDLARIVKDMSECIHNLYDDVVETPSGGNGGKAEPPCKYPWNRTKSKPDPNQNNQGGNSQNDPQSNPQSNGQQGDPSSNQQGGQQSPQNGGQQSPQNGGQQGGDPKGGYRGGNQQGGQQDGSQQGGNQQGGNQQGGQQGGDPFGGQQGGGSQQGGGQQGGDPFSNSQNGNSSGDTSGNQDGNISKGSVWSSLNNMEMAEALRNGVMTINKNMIGMSKGNQQALQDANEGNGVAQSVLEQAKSCGACDKATADRLLQNLKTIEANPTNLDACRKAMTEVFNDLFDAIKQIKASTPSENNQSSDGQGGEAQGEAQSKQNENPSDTGSGASNTPKETTELPSTEGGTGQSDGSETGGYGAGGMSLAKGVYTNTAKGMSERLSEAGFDDSGDAAYNGEQVNTPFMPPMEHIKKSEICEKTVVFNGKVIHLPKVHLDVRPSIKDATGSDLAAQKASERMRQALRIYQADHPAEVAGTIADGQDRLIDYSESSSLDWKKLLQQYLKSSHKRIANYARPNQVGFGMRNVLPVVHKQEKHKDEAELKILVDVSGSVSDSDIRWILGEIAHMFKLFRRVSGELVYWSNSIDSVGTFKNLKELGDIPIKTTGGTEIAGVLYYLGGSAVNGFKSTTKNGFCLIVTDGCFSLPNGGKCPSYLAKDQSRIYWLITGSKKSVKDFAEKCHFGRICHFT